jgi:hypothetical protein
MSLQHLDRRSLPLALEREERTLLVVLVRYCQHLHIVGVRFHVKLALVAEVLHDILDARRRHALKRCHECFHVRKMAAHSKSTPPITHILATVRT